MDHEKAEHLRKNLTGVCMILAPLCFLASDALWPVTHTEAADVLADATGNTGQIAAGLALLMVGLALMVGAVIGLAHMLHDRRPGMAMLGAGLSLAGLLCVAAVATLGGGVVFEAVQGGRDAAAMESLVHDLLNGPVAVLGTATELLTIGLVVMAVGLARSRVVAM